MWDLLESQHSRLWKIQVRYLKKSSGSQKSYRSSKNYDTKKMNALVQEQVARALRKSKKMSRGSKKSPNDHSENFLDSENNDSREEWGEILVLNPGRKRDSHNVSTTSLGTIQGNQESPKTICIYY